MPAYHYQQGDRPLEGFTIQHALGRGGFGEVYFALSDAGREVALKSVQNFEDIELRGIGHCMNLKSPHLVMIFDVKQGTDGTPWVIMEYVAGASLRAILDAAPMGLEPQQAVFLIRELAKGIDYLHDAGIVHRDLKPHNVFFEDGHVKIGDYSLSKVITGSQASGHTMTVGSVHYMAPEISMGRYDKTVDLYALGVMLFEMMTGTPPFVGESVGEVLMKHLSGQVDVSGLAEPFAGVVKKAMNRDPKQRFQSAKEMADALAAGMSLEINDSIPASLSMVGRKALTSAPRPIEVPMRPVGPIPGKGADRNLSDTVNAIRATSDTAESIVTPLTQSDAHAVGPQTRQRTTFRRLSCVTLSLYSTLLLMTLALLLYGDEAGPVVVTWASVMLAISVWLIALTLTMTLVHLVPKRRGAVDGWVTRAWICGLWLIVYVMVRFVADRSPPLNALGGCLLGTLAATLLVDWRGLSDPNRAARLLIKPTLIVSAISGLVAALYEMNMDHAILAMATATAAAVTVQLVSPWGGPFDPGVSSERASRATDHASHRSSNDNDHPEIDRSQHSLSTHPFKAEIVA